MTSIERRLVRELHEAAADIDAGSVPPLVLPRGQAHPGPASAAPRRLGPKRHLTPRMLAPLAAAASVLAVAAGAVTLGALSRNSEPSPATRSSVLGSVPRYYVAVTAAEAGNPQARHAGIYATRTGALLASIRAPRAYPAFVDVSAAANDRTFALAARAYPHDGRAAMTFYLATFRPGERSVNLTGIAAAQVPAGASFDGFALSPDGRSLAFAYEQAGMAGVVTEVLKVVDIATGTVRTWTSANGNVAAAGLGSHPLSWSANDRMLAFAWYGTGTTAGSMLATTGLRLLRIGSPGPGLVSSSRRAVRLYDVAGHLNPFGLVPTSAMLASGGEVVAVAGTNLAGTAGGFAEFSALTGRRIGTLWWKPVPSATSATSAGSMAVLWASGSGSTLIVSGPPGHPGQIAVLRSHQLFLLPRSARTAFPAAAW